MKSRIVFYSAAAMLTIEPAQAQKVATECVDDQALKNLGPEAFDQGPEGWRALAAVPGCEKVAIKLLKEYRESLIIYIPLLYWHEGQINAEIGNRKGAIDLMKLSIQPDPDLFGWNKYVRASIAYLRKDKVNFLRERRALQRLPKPSDWPRDEEWPQNMNIVENLNRCFNYEYKIAYSGKC